jgi:CheY-like chemotaxis protein
MNKKLTLGKDIAVLIVDDNHKICSTLSDILSEEGYSIFKAETVAAAQRQVSEQFYNVVLVDLKLKDGSGLDVLKAVKARQRFDGRGNFQDHRVSAEKLCHGRRPAPRDQRKCAPSHGNGDLPRHSPPQGLAGQRPEDKNQCPHP